MRTLFNRIRSIRKKFILILIIVISLATISIGWLAINQMSKNIRVDVERFSSQILTQVNLNIDRYFNQYEQGVFLLGSSTEFSNWLQAEVGKTADVVLRFRRVEEKYINPLIASHPEIMSVTFLNENGNEMHYSRSPGLKKGYTAMNEPELLDVPFSRKLSAYIRNSKDYVNANGGIEELQVITLVKKLRYGNSNGFIKIDISLQPTLAILNEIQLGKTGVGFIANEDGVIMAHPNEELMMTSMDDEWREPIFNRPSGAWFHQSAGEMVIFETIPYTNWKSVAVVPYKELAQSVYRTRDLIIMIVAASLIVATSVGIALSSSITSRILRLRRVMSQTQTGNLQSRVVLEGDDELTDLGRSYNKMLDHLESSIVQLAESRGHQQEAVLSILQSQINSHFLYNALESINSMATLASHKEISSTTLSLSNMLRYTSNYQNNCVTINDEMNHLLDYLNIMSTLYEDDITWELHCPSVLGEAPCLKAIVQPIVENAIKHGVETTGQAIHICVRVEHDASDGIIRILISDNGTGFSADRLADIRQRLSVAAEVDNYKRQKSLGLSNVHYRLRMYYKPVWAGLQVGNLEQGGALIKLTFPFIQDEKSEAQEMISL